MNWRLSQLDKYTLVSNSDLHSFWPWRIGREANIFDLDKITYNNILNILKTKENFIETIEVDPAYGKYHYDGHRKCNVCLKPTETMKLQGICPVCKKPLTIGVEYRVEELADRPVGFKPRNAIPFRSLIPLSEIISKIVGKAMTTKTVWTEYNKLIKEFDNEYNILLNVGSQELKKVCDEKLATAIVNSRLGNIKVQPGFDGEYGIPLFSESDKREFHNIEKK
jgi:uncharacterized protein (TIGR00375 family)